MPTITNPMNGSNQPPLEYACEGIIIQYATIVLREGKFANIGGSGLFTQYEKRQDFARKSLLMPSFYAKSLASLCEIIEPNISFNVLQNGFDLYRYLVDGNPTGRSVMENIVDFASWNHVGSQSGISVFDALAGISNGDIQ